VSSAARTRGVPAGRRTSSEPSTLLRSVIRAEVGYALLLISAFVLPVWIEYRAWIPALALATGLAAAQGLLAGRRPVLPAAILAYLGAYLIAGLHSDPDTFSVIEAGKFFAPPIFALAVAWAAIESSTRRIIVILSIAAVAIQIPVVIGEVVDILIRYGRDGGLSWVDSISGMLGPQQGSPLTQVGIMIGILLIAAAYVGKLAPAIWIGGGLVTIGLGLLTSTRASYVFVPAALIVLAVTLWVASRRGARARLSPWIATVLSVGILPVLILGTAAVFEGANEGLNSVSALVTGLDRGDQQFEIERDLARSSSGRAATGRRSGDRERLTVLPGRGRQLTLALELSDDEGPATLLLGRGIGSTRFKEQGVLSPTGATADPLRRPEQRTNGVWLARTISETGYVGLAAFLWLLGFLVWLWWRNVEIINEPSWDAAVIFSLPAIAALTLVSSAYNTILAIQPYATLFWALLGVAIAIDFRQRNGMPA
jgi:hypothetical protein